jgi:uncharacterized damage-inducible protein DinB
MNTLTFESLQSLQQLRELLLQLSDAEYQHPHPCYFGGTVGKHTRHILEFYQQLLSARDAVHYDNRRRDLCLESSVQSALDALDTVARYLATGCDERPLQVDADVFADGLPANSSYMRELFYAYEHTVHHMALLRVGAYSAFPHLQFPANFGVAYATQKHQQACVQ